MGNTKAERGSQRWGFQRTDMQCSPLETPSRLTRLQAAEISHVKIISYI